MAKSKHEASAKQCCHPCFILFSDAHDRRAGDLADEQAFPTEDLVLGIALIRRFRQFLSENQEELSALDPRIQPK